MHKVLFLKKIILVFGEEEYRIVVVETVSLKDIFHILQS
jgi:hypothetical protein